jgi:hypothetical protein
MASSSRAHVWRAKLIDDGGPDSATTRYLLMFLSMRMEDDVCRLSPREIAEAALLDRKTVVVHLRRAERAGWLARRHIQKRSKAWRRMEYLPWWPTLGPFHGKHAGERGAPA